MSKKITYDIPATLVHTVNGREYRVNGKIVGINESAETVSMTFSGYKGIEHNIPMSNVYVTEGIIDTLKTVGRKAITSVKKLIQKVNGFLFPKDDNGACDFRYMNHPVNIAILNARGELPECVYFSPNDNIIKTTAEFGINVTKNTDPLELAAARESEENNRYWGRVMREYVKNESMSFKVSDAVKVVNEKYYTDVRKKALNESLLSLRNPGAVRGKYGLEMNYSECVGTVISNVLALLDRKIGGSATTGPILVWGAPGIGKTSILQGVINQLKEDYRLNLMYSYVSCSGLFQEEWSLPTLTKNSNNNQTLASSAPKTWLPVFDITNCTDEEIAELDLQYNDGTFKEGKSTYNGGIIFFDEFSRLPLASRNVMMNLLSECTFDNMLLASRWATVLASNRLEDVYNGNEEDFQLEEALKTRFQQITFVPTLLDWLTWARRPNRATGRQNIDEMFCSFIELAGVAVWYDALDFGSRDNVLSDDDKKAVNNYVTGHGEDSIANALAILDNDKIKSNIAWNPRTWQRDINNRIFGDLKNMIFRGHVELYNSIFDKGNLVRTKLKKALDCLSPNEWERWARNHNHLDDPKKPLSRIDFFDKWCERVIAGATTGDDTSLVAHEWKTYNTYKKTFTPKVCTSIWETGKLPEALQADDDITCDFCSDYLKTNTSKWKSLTNLAKEVVKTIIDNFPGGIKKAREIAMEDAEKIAKTSWSMDPNDANKKNVRIIKPSEFNNYVKKWTEEYTLFKKPRLIISPIPAAKQQCYLNMFKTLEESQLARMLANAALYILKISIQMKCGEIKQDAENIFDYTKGTFIKDIIGGDDTRQEALVKYNELVNYKKAGNEQAIQELAYSLIGFPAYYILFNDNKLIINSINNRASANK